MQRSLLKINKALRGPSPSGRPAQAGPRDPDGGATHGPTGSAVSPPDVTSAGATPGQPDPPPLRPDPASGRVKFPKISLPHFKGNPIYWTAFWDSYESAVHLNSALSEVDKFNYLRSLLEKSAYDAITGLTLTTRKPSRF